MKDLRKLASRLEAFMYTQNKEEPINKEKAKNVKQEGEKVRS